MEEKKVTMTIEELKRVEVMTELERGGISGKEAAEIIKRSVRQTRRIIRKYRERGAEGLVHGNRGKPSPNRLDGEIRLEIQQLLKKSYADYNTLHLVEVLEERHGIRISASSLTRIRRQAGYPTPRQKKSQKYYSRRARKPNDGQMLQADGSLHDWLEGRGEKLTLIAYIDDTTNKVYATFRKEEDAAGYLEVLQEVCLTDGIPQSVYLDKRMLSRKQASLAEQLAGKEPQSQFERVLAELGIELIIAHSPQAKGRIERLFDTLQDRLVKALREAGADSLQSANQVLKEFLPAYNDRFRIETQLDTSAFVPWPGEIDPDNLFVFKYTRTVKNDNTILFDRHSLQLPPGKDRRSFAKATVDLHQHLNGLLTVHYHGIEIARFDHNPDLPLKIGKFTPARDSSPPSNPSTEIHTQQENSKPVRNSSPANDHPWKQFYGYHLNGKLVNKPDPTIPR